MRRSLPAYTLPFVDLLRHSATRPTFRFLISTMATAASDPPAVESSIADDDAKFGFKRAEMNENLLPGTVDLYECHLFLCYKSAESWPAQAAEGHDADLLPRFLWAALKSRKEDIPRKIKFTICEGGEGSHFSNGDVLIFPDMIKYRGLAHTDVDSFVEDVLVKGNWVPGNSELISGSHVFVCAHASRDKRCGVCGPILVKNFKEEIERRGLKDSVFVVPCSHVGGHKYAGNVILFSPDPVGKIVGHWYGYVTPKDVPVLLDQQIEKGEIVDRLWRGQMGMSKEDQIKSYEHRLQQNIEEVLADGINAAEGDKEITGGDRAPEGVTCCQGTDGFTCCMDQGVGISEVAEVNAANGLSCNDKVVESTEVTLLKNREVAVDNAVNGFSCCKDKGVEGSEVTPGGDANVFSCCKVQQVETNGATAGTGAKFTCCKDKGLENGEVPPAEDAEKDEKLPTRVSTLFRKWDQSDVLMTVGVIGVLASVGVAYSVYRRSG
ncbi:hypothetical protein H6P81_012615 [Aristolochia fimbriata]|uniref:Altered inheritance of mitochondria protein 32 n=1 Tax=Aristolochia fimbriata TaxID=158543 RepID=A0AAV7EFY7_ARIFI|nr:hypothetical protein H6P81_012615 [Aristolochia fimbriata]